MNCSLSSYNNENCSKISYDKDEENNSEDKFTSFYLQYMKKGSSKTLQTKKTKYKGEKIDKFFETMKDFKFYSPGNNINNFISNYNLNLRKKKVNSKKLKNSALSNEVESNNINKKIKRNTIFQIDFKSLERKIMCKNLFKLKIRKGILHIMRLISIYCEGFKRFIHKKTKNKLKL